jgi:hypothetical protein
MRRLQSYVAKYGPVAGPRLYHALQSQAAHAGVNARLRRKIEALTAPRPRGGAEASAQPTLPFVDAPASYSSPPSPRTAIR